MALNRLTSTLAKSLRNEWSAATTVCVRQLSDKAGNHSPPLKLFGVEARYANALFTAASKAGKLDAVESELAAFKAVLEKNDIFASFLSNPTISRVEKVSQLGALLKDSKASYLTSNLLMSLASNARLEEITKVITSFNTLMRAHRGELSVTIVAPTALTKAEISSIVAACKAAGMVESTDAIDVKVEEDASLLGGFTVQIGDSVVDRSLRSKMQEFSRTLSS